MAKKYIVRLTDEEREQLLRLSSSGSRAARKITRARALLQADTSEAGPGWTDEHIAEALAVSVRFVEMLRQRFVLEGLAACLSDKPRRPRPNPKLDGEREARLIALSCSQPPPGRQRWTLRLLASRMVELKVVDAISHETIRRAFQKTS
jgi:transposase